MEEQGTGIEGGIYISENAWKDHIETYYFKSIQKYVCETQVYLDLLHVKK